MVSISFSPLQNDIYKRLVLADSFKATKATNLPIITGSGPRMPNGSRTSPALIILVYHLPMEVEGPIVKNLWNVAMHMIHQNFGML